MLGFKPYCFKAWQLTSNLRFDWTVSKGALKGRYKRSHASENNSTLFRFWTIKRGNNLIENKQIFTIIPESSVINQSTEFLSA